jgi:hypothetical protein
LKFGAEPQSGLLVIWPFDRGESIAESDDLLAIVEGAPATDTFGTIIYTTSGSSPETGGVHVSANSLASAIDVYEWTDLEQFREAYQWVARAKRLRKTPPKNLGAR